MLIAQTIHHLFENITHAVSAAFVVATTLDRRVLAHAVATVGPKSGSLHGESAAQLGDDFYRAALAGARPTGF